jgi:hypothetical protein
VAAGVVVLGTIVGACGAGDTSSSNGERGGAPTTTSAPAPTTTKPAPLTAGPIAAWGGTAVKVACLTIDQENPQVPGYAYPVADWVNQMLGPVGVTTVGPDQPCDATLDVSMYMEGRPFDFDFGGGPVTVYAGVLRHFDLNLNAPGQPAVTGFSNRTDTCGPSDSACYATSNDPRSPQEFLDHYADVFRNFTLNGLVQVWGAPVGIEALRDPSLTFVADQALRDFSGLGRPGTPPSPEGYDGWRQWYETQP